MTTLDRLQTLAKRHGLDVWSLRHDWQLRRGPHVVVMARSPEALVGWLERIEEEDRRAAEELDVRTWAGE